MIIYRLLHPVASKSPQAADLTLRVVKLARSMGQLGVTLAHSRIHTWAQGQGLGQERHLGPDTLAPGESVSGRWRTQTRQKTCLQPSGRPTGCSRSLGEPVRMGEREIGEEEYWEQGKRWAG